MVYFLLPEDKKRYPNILQAGTPQRPYYTNSSQSPVGFTDDPFLAIDHQNELQKRYTGGTVLHFYVNERISSVSDCKLLVRRILENSNLPYITITPTFSICPNHGYLAGEHPFCPRCQERQPCEVWTRVVGYHRPVSAFNPGKRSEHEERRYFVEQDETVDY